MQPEHVPLIARLPLEILETLVDYAPIETQLSICRVSKLFQSLAVRSIYRNLSLCSPDIAVDCCRTLTSNSSTAAVVRSFCIVYKNFPLAAKPPLPSYYATIQNALHSLSDLMILRLLVHDPSLVSLLTHSVFPSLRQFECFLTPTTCLITFLNLHPNIDYLQVSPHEDTEEPPLGGEVIVHPRTLLPRLQYFSGNAQSIGLIEGTQKLKAAFLTWHAVDTDPELVLAALGRGNRASLNLLSCTRRGWNLDLFETVSTHVPEILCLHLSNILLVDSRPTETYLQAIRAFLPRMTRLQRFCVNCIDYFEMGSVTCQLDQDFSTVTEWGAACPSLEEIGLPHSQGLSWYRLAGNSWLPDPQHPLGEQWLSKSIARRRLAWGSILNGLPESQKRASGHPSEFGESVASIRTHLDIFLRESRTIIS
ncbi:hypothetical protein CPB83DRAFT_849145 [Crepidotus variabilis]|uniref:F-box domain-containing protein n=1 Tax=Crepidotus variabilis TaxID=179855 RepID=A0A9P6EMC7_9AGAR|nr:hypothetical protein CPB83DRAFT_849145 [Crepidotus variabilis]